MVRNPYASARSNRSPRGAAPRDQPGAKRSEQRVGRGRNGEGAVGEADHEAADRAAFGVIGVQQGRIGLKGAQTRR
jgi:hypothetical protein